MQAVQLGLGTAAHEDTYLQIRSEWVWEPHVSGEGTQYQISQLDAVRWDHITEPIMVITKEFWEVMQKNQQHS